MNGPDFAWLRARTVWLKKAELDDVKRWRDAATLDR